MKKETVAIIGGGAAGVMAAISASKAGHSVTVCERLKTLGKKVLASGGGRCNFTNVNVGPEFFHPEEYDFVKGVFDRFGKKDIDDFFLDLGLYSYAGEDGRVFPISNRSQSVMDVLKNEMNRLGVTLTIKCDVKEIRKTKKGFELKPLEGNSVFAEKIILCSGGKTYPALGSDGHGYKLAASLGHTIIKPVPITLPIETKDPWCHLLQGQKVRGRAASIVNGKQTEWIEGDILFTQYGLSGTAIFDATDAVSIAQHRDENKDTYVICDLVPFLTEDELCQELNRKLAKGFPVTALIDGLLSPKFVPVLKDYLNPNRTRELAHFLKNRKFKVLTTKGWNEAEFTAGGVALDEVNPDTLESRIQKGLYFAGEILNVQGRRGGYNLAWAWASGHVVGALR